MAAQNLKPYCPSPQQLREAMEKAWQRRGVKNANGPTTWLTPWHHWRANIDGYNLPLEENINDDAKH